MKYSKIPLLSPKSIHMYSALEYIEYIKSLRQLPESKSRSSKVEGINISLGKRLIIKVKKEEKRFNEVEINLLCEEFKLEKQEFLNQLMKRKIEVQDATGLIINSKPAKIKKARDAKPKQASRRKKKDSHKQLESRHDSELSKESIL